mgnify:CR=1 FL=1
MIKKSLPFTILIFSLVIFLFNCNSINIEDEITEATNKWNNDIKVEKIEGLEVLYAKEVNYYGKKISNQEIIKRKLKFVNKHNDFEQSISELKVTKLNSNEYRCGYIKNAIFGGKKYEINSYLIFENKEGNLYIIEENDSEILKKENLNSELQYDLLEKKNTPCFELIFKAMRKALDLQEFGGHYFLMLDVETLGEYHISMKEDQETHVVTVERFIFDYVNKKLFNCNEFSREKLTEIKIDKNYLDQLNNVCK